MASQFCENVVIVLILFQLAGVEDGQTVRVPVEAGEIFVTFKVCGKNQSVSVFKFWCVSKCRYESKLNFFYPG